jgi:hypothetical protein
MFPKEVRLILLYSLCWFVLPLLTFLLWLCDFYMFDLVWIKQDTFFLAAFHRVAPPTPPDAIAVYLDLEDQ